jgi:NAD(P)-dependent dehydrogenase (short-subunit alcohol dehydrogenase family)
VVDPLVRGGVHERVQGDQPVVTDVGDGFGGADVLHEAGAHVVVAGAGDERDRDGRQQLGGHLVLDVEPVVGHVSAQQQDVRRRRARGDVVEGAAQPGGRLVGGPHVAIAQVGDDEPGHAVSVARSRRITKVRNGSGARGRSTVGSRLPVACSLDQGTSGQRVG